MAECTHNCSTCSEKCSKESLLAPANAASKVKRVIGVVSGKGGVGKSLVTSMLAVTMQRRGYKTAILDADITGPSIPKAFGLKPGCVTGSDLGMFPPVTKTGIEVMSVNLLMDEETKPVVWRGPVIAGTVKQFWSDVVWNDDIGQRCARGKRSVTDAGDTAWNGYAFNSSAFIKCILSDCCHRFIPDDGGDHNMLVGTASNTADIVGAVKIVFEFQTVFRGCASIENHQM